MSYIAIATTNRKTIMLANYLAVASTESLENLFGKVVWKITDNSRNKTSMLASYLTVANDKKTV